MDEYPYTNTRIDAEGYADTAMQALAHIIGPLSARRQGWIRDELVEAFEEGQHQETCRALVILRIARERTTSKKARMMLEKIAFLLAPHLRDPA